MSDRLSRLLQWTSDTLDYFSHGIQFRKRVSTGVSSSLRPEFAGTCIRMEAAAVRVFSGNRKRNEQSDWGGGTVVAIGTSISLENCPDAVGSVAAPMSQIFRIAGQSVPEFM